METSTVNIAFKRDLLKLIDKIAKDESRSRSELIREAARMYIDRKNKWKLIFEFAEKQAKMKNVIEDDILDEVKKYRQTKKS